MTNMRSEIILAPSFFGMLQKFKIATPSNPRKGKSNQFKSVQSEKKSQKPLLTIEKSKQSHRPKSEKAVFACCTDLVRCKTWWKNAVQDKKFKSLMGNTYVCISSFVSAGTFFSWALQCMWVETYWTNYPTDCRGGAGEENTREHLSASVHYRLSP